MDKHYPQNSIQHQDSYVVIFGAITKIALIGVRNRVRESLVSQLI